MTMSFKEWKDVRMLPRLCDLIGPSVAQGHAQIPEDHAKVIVIWINYNLRYLAHRL